MERMEMDVLMIRVNACLNSGRHTEARRLLEQVLEAEPAHGVAHGMMGWVLWALVNDHERALMHFRLGVRWASGHTVTWMHYLNLLAGDGLEQELHEVYHRALAVPGIDATEVRCIVARYLERTGRMRDAITVYRAALRSAGHASEAEIRTAMARLRRRVRRARWASLLS